MVSRSLWQRPVGRFAAFKRLVQLAAMILLRPGGSLPQQLSRWSDTKGGYRLLSNPAVQGRAMAQPHCRLTHESCQGQSVVLAVQDDSDVTGRSKALREADHVQHTTLAVLPEGGVLGMLDLGFFQRVKRDKTETALERESRWRETCVWSDAIRAIGPAPEGCRMIHVADRAADDLNFMDEALSQKCGFLVRAQHDRRLEGDQKLWERLGAEPAAGVIEATIGTQRDAKGKIKRIGRAAKLTVRFAAVVLLPPHNHPGKHHPLKVWAVYLTEENPPPDHEPANREPVDWMLLCSEPVESFEDAVRVAGWYQKRWTIEEYHRVLKEGLRLEKSQLDEIEDQERLSGILSVIAVRLLQLRDLADDPQSADDPGALRKFMPPLWIAMVSNLAEVEPQTLTPRLFYLTIARRGGYLNRRSDPRPGWKVLWRGWQEVSWLVEGAARMKAAIACPGP